MQEKAKNLWYYALVLNLILLSVLSFFTHDVFAQNIYEDCVKSYDFGDIAYTPVVVRPIGDVCHDRCKNECNGFSRKNGGIELNSDIIDKCMVSCVNGNLYSSQVRKTDSSAPGGYIWTTDNPPPTTATFCSVGSTSIDSAANNAYTTNLAFKKDDKVSVTLFYPPGGIDNEVIMCGYNRAAFLPKFESLSFSDWNNNTGIWSPMNNSEGTYSARNPNYIDTGIDIKDGDVLNITWGGQYRSNCSPTWCNPATYDRNLFIKSPLTSFPDANAQSDHSGALIMPGGNLLFVKPNADNTGYEANADPETVYLNNQNVKFLGLQGSSFQIGNRFKGTLNFDVTPTPSALSNGSTMVQINDSYIQFKGTLTGFSQRFARLAFTNADALPTSAKTKWANHLGGLQVEIVRKGCVHTRGDLLQYGIAKPDPTSDTKNPIYLPVSQWYDVTSNNIDDPTNNPIVIPDNGILNFRIKPVDYNPSLSPSCAHNDLSCLQSINTVASLYTIGNRSGQYYVVVKQPKDKTSGINIMSTIVKMMRGYLFGDPTKNEPNGLVQTLFNKLVAHSAMMKAVQVLLAFYIAWTGLSFMIGIAPITQKEGAVRIIKIGIVSTLITPQSWEFFNTYVFQMFTDGALELLVRLTALPDITPQKLQNYLEDPVTIFDSFDEPLVIMFARQTWLKVLGLLFTSPMGFVILIVIIIAAVLYIITLAKALLAYLVSLLGIAVLLILAPIFICFLLFQFTRQMFDAWLKQLMGFVFQPIFIFVFIIVLNYLIILALKLTLGFTVCKVCMLSFSFPGQTSTCLLEGWMAMRNMHMPGGPTNIPISTIMPAFYLLILVQAAYVFADFGGKIATLIVTGGFLGMDAMKGSADIIASGQTTVAKTLGIDASTTSVAEGMEAKAFKQRQQAAQKSGGTGGGQGSSGNQGGNQGGNQSSNQGGNQGGNQ